MLRKVTYVNAATTIPGVIPNTEILKDCGVHMDERGYVVVDGEMRTNVKDLYAGGDIASFPMQMTGFSN